MDDEKMVYWTADDGYGDMCLWSGRSRDDEQCDVVLVQRGTPTIVWETCLAQLVTVPADTDGVLWTYEHTGDNALAAAIRYYRQHSKGKTPGLRESKEAVEAIIAAASAKAGA